MRHLSGVYMMLEWIKDIFADVTPWQSKHDP